MYEQFLVIETSVLMSASVASSPRNVANTRLGQVASGPAGSAWDVRTWASYSKPLGAPRGNYTWNVPKSCSMELCALGSFGATLQQANPALELPLVRRLRLGADPPPHSKSSLWIRTARQ